MPGNIIVNVRVSAKKLILSLARLIVYPRLLGNVCVDAERQEKRNVEKVRNRHIIIVAAPIFLNDNVPGIIIKPQHSL